MQDRRFLYWLIVGALLGIGVVGIDSIGIFLFATALPLIVFGALRWRARRIWAVLIGFGAAPALLLAFDVLTAGPRCPANGAITLPPGVNYAACSGPMNEYVMLTLLFGGIALLGVLWPLMVRLVRHPGARAR